MTSNTTTAPRPLTTVTAPGAPAVSASAAVRTSAPTRRTFLAGASAVSAVSAVSVGSLLSGSFTPAAAAGLPMVTPVWSESIRRSFGVAVQPQFIDSPYGDAAAWPKYVSQMGATWIRGKYNISPNLRASNDTIIKQCRMLGLKWVMTVIPEDWSMSIPQLKAVLADIRGRAADVCIAIEGMNEPNHNKDGSPLRRDWAAATVAYQKVIWDFVHATPSMSHVSVLSPSLQMGGKTPLTDFNALTAAGIKGKMDYAGMHSYPAGLKPDNQIETRLGYVRSAWGAVPTWVSETGYNNAMAAPMAGPRPVPVDVAATYGPRSVLEYFSRGCKSARYELLSEPDPKNADCESGYGLLNCPSNDPATWTLKPEYNVMRKFLGGLKDTATNYKPTAVPLQVTAPSTVKWVLTAKSDGTTTLYAYLNSSIWDVAKRTHLNPAPVNVKVTDRAGTRTIKVGAAITAIKIR